MKRDLVTAQMQKIWIYNLRSAQNTLCCNFHIYNPYLQLNKVIKIELDLLEENTLIVDLKENPLNSTLFKPIKELFYISK